MQNYLPPVWLYGRFLLLICIKKGSIVSNDDWSYLVCSLKYFRMEFEQDYVELTVECEHFYMEMERHRTFRNIMNMEDASEEIIG